MGAFRIADLKWKFTFGFSGADVDDDALGFGSVLDENHAIFSDRLGGVGFGTLGSVVVPEDFYCGIDERDAVLVGEKHIIVRQQHRVADFPATAGWKDL